MMDLLGWGEWGVIAILALVIVGPKDLPRFLYKIGQWLAKIRESTAGLRQEFDGLMRLEHLKDLPAEDETDRDGPAQNTLLSRDILPLAIVQTKSQKTSSPRRPRKRKSA